MGNSENQTIRVGSAILIIEGDTVLLGKRNKEPEFGKWVLPGGKIEYGETHEQAAIREAREELGVEIEITGLAGKGIYHILPPERHRLIIYSTARLAKGMLRPSTDISEACFFRRDELEKLELTNLVREVLHDTGWI